MEYNAKKELYHFVDRLRIDWGVTSYEQPFNAIEMSMYHAEIIYHTFDTDGFCGAAFTGNRIDTIVLNDTKYSLQGTTQGRYLTGGVPPVRFSM